MLIRNVLFGLILAAVEVVRAQHVPVTGVAIDANNKEVPLRKNIDNLQKAGGAQWDLYLQALASLYKDKPSDTTSFFQIAGIHGRPYVEWNKAGPKTTQDKFAGYCPHGEKLFMTWHRPFVLLYEQVLVARAKKIADGYPSRYRAQYQAAAATLRSPYWDWAANSQVPAVTVPSKIRVNVPDGDNLKAIDIDNPLGTYKFPADALSQKLGEFKPSGQTQMTRCPAPKSYPKTGNENMSKRPYKRWIYDTFSHSKDFAAFASTGAGGISIEQIHNGVHWDATCAGLFLDAQYSAFDPLFMLLHTNVDRFWAYWAAINPQHASFSVPYPGGSRFSSPKGASIGADSPLHPFFQANGQFHTTRSVTSFKNFGYTYAGLEYRKKNDLQMQTDAKVLINKLYGPTQARAARFVRRDGNETMRYFAQLEFKVEELERPCSVDVLIAGQHAGAMIVMAQPSSGIIHASLPIDDAIEAAGMDNIPQKDMVDAIKASIEVSIQNKDGSIYLLERVPSLHIEIEENVVILPSSLEELPEFIESVLTDAEPIDAGKG